jgi:iron complex outermembrane receptor protein
MNTKPLGMNASPSELYERYYGDHRGSATDDNVSAFAGIESWVSDRLSIGFDITRAERSPDTTERFIAANAMQASQRWIGDPGLNPEVHTVVAPSVQWTEKAFEISVTGFYDWADDFIARDRARLQQGVFENDGAQIYRNVEAELWGAETEVIYSFDAPFTVKAWVAYVRGTNTTDNRDLPQIPPLSGRVAAAYTLDLVTLEPSIMFALTQDQVDADPATGSGLDVEETSGYVTAQIRLSYALSEAVRIDIVGANLFDQEYANHLNRGNIFDPTGERVTEPGRSVMLQLRMEG